MRWVCDPTRAWAMEILVVSVVFSSLKMKPDVVLRHLSIAVAATDQSYMPQQVTVAVGRSASDLQEVRDVHIPSNVTGYVTLLENANISQLCEFNSCGL